MEIFLTYVNSEFAVFHAPGRVDEVPQKTVVGITERRPLFQRARDRQADVVVLESFVTCAVTESDLLISVPENLTLGHALPS